MSQVKYGIMEAKFKIYFSITKEDVFISIPEKDIMNKKSICLKDENSYKVICFGLLIKINLNQSEGFTEELSNQCSSIVNVIWISKEKFDKYITNNMSSRNSLLIEKYNKTQIRVISYKYCFQNRHSIELFKMLEFRQNNQENSFQTILRIQSKIIRRFRHNGNSVLAYGEPIINTLLNTKEELTCMGFAKLLTEMLLINKIKARIVICKQKEKIDYDAHVVVLAYVEEIDKFVMFDPTYNLYITDQYDVPLSISEIRERLINKLPMKIYPKSQYNNSELSFELYIRMLEKKFYRFYTPCSSYPGSEHISNLIGLVPSLWIESNLYETDNDLLFWKMI